ncbi:hypothetical protein PFISCL1PPCAC_910, partial [Pristionchus fissidentatus]
ELFHLFLSFLFYFSPLVTTVQMNVIEIDSLSLNEEEVRLDKIDNSESNNDEIDRTREGRVEQGEQRRRDHSDPC